MVENNGWHLPDALARWLAPVLRASRQRMLVLLASLATVGLALLLMARTAPQTRAESPAANTAAESAFGQNSEAQRLAAELASILCRLKGAGEVEVRLTLANTPVNQWEENVRRNQRTVEDRGQDGQWQVTTEESEETTLALARQPDGSESPVSKQASSPRVVGAIIVADGAGDAGVRADLARAAAAFLDLGLHRIMVFPREEVP